MTNFDEQKSTSSNPIPLTPELIEALDYIILETEYAVYFQKESLARIRAVCEAIQSGHPLPFKKGE